MLKNSSVELFFNRFQYPMGSVANPSPNFAGSWGSRILPNFSGSLKFGLSLGLPWLKSKYLAKNLAAKYAAHNASAQQKTTCKCTAVMIFTNSPRHNGQSALILGK